MKTFLFKDISDSEVREHLANVFSILTSNEVLCLVHRFGLDDGNSKTLQETADELKVTMQQIRLIELKALRKIRVSMANGDMFNLKEIWYSDEILI